MERHSKLLSNPDGSDPRSDLFVWIDMEMTGLNVEHDRILEIAVVITDERLSPIAEGPDLVLNQPDELLDGMDEWNTSHHGDSGLTEQVRASKITDAEAERQVLEFLHGYCVPNTALLCGNSVWQDRRFIARYMKDLDEFLHYRIIDVSTVKELARRWRPQAFDLAPQKQEAHRALDDIRESIVELKHYRRSLFL